MDAKGQQGQVHNQGQPTHCPAEDEYIISVPMVRPKQPFLNILRLAGATGETFTRKEIIVFLKNYISSRRLYDVNNPRVVYCGNDQLGQVFGVQMFTIDDVFGLLNRNCYGMPDSCLKRKCHLVSKPLASNSSNILPPSCTIPLCHPLPRTDSSVVTSTTSPVKGSKCISMPYTKSRKSSSSSSDNYRFRKSNKRKASVGSSFVATDTNGIEPAATAIMENEVTAEGANKLPRLRPENNTTVSTDNQNLHKEAPPIDDKSPLGCDALRHQRTSLGISYSDNEGTHGYPWYFKIQLDHNQNEEDGSSEVLSVQDKETATVRDSTDDLWFLEEDSIVVEVSSDTDLSVEYDIACAEESPATESDLSSVRSGEGLLVVCKESDVEFFADYSDSDTNSDEDPEISEADNWTCTECLQTNTPLQRYCGKCWKLKKDWLPNHRSSQDGNHVDNVKLENVKCDQMDSGMGSSVLTSSQEAVISDVSLHKQKESVLCDMQSFNNLTTPVSNHSCFIAESKDIEVRHSFFNRQMRNKSSSSSLVSNCSSTLVQEVQNNFNSTELKFSSNVPNEPCMICLSRPKDASLIHGSSGHQVCCFSCAIQLKRRGKVCPICRQHIQKVVKNYIL